MTQMINLQDICKIKELKTSIRSDQNINERIIDEINLLLSKGWILLKISTTIFTENFDHESQVTAEVLSYVLGFPHSGISYVADQHRPEFDQ